MTQNNLFYQDNHISDTGVLDNMVHSAIAAISKRNMAANIVVGQIKEFSLCFLPKIGENMETTVSIVSKKGRSIVVDTFTCVEGETAATCRIKMFIEKEKDETAGNIL